MFKKLLLPIDLADKHQRAVEIATDLARQSGGELVLLHVIEVIAGLSMDEEKNFYHRLETAAREHLARLGDLLRQRGVASQADVLYGKRGPEIVRHARENGVDLIVLTAPAVDLNHPVAGWASLSHKVGLLASCPVLLVK